MVDLTASPRTVETATTPWSASRASADVEGAYGSAFNDRFSAPRPTTVSSARRRRHLHCDASATTCSTAVTRPGDRSHLRRLQDERGVTVNLADERSVVVGRLGHFQQACSRSSGDSGRAIGPLIPRDDDASGSMRAGASDRSMALDGDDGSGRQGRRRTKPSRRAQTEMTSSDGGSRTDRLQAPAETASTAAEHAIASKAGVGLGAVPARELRPGTQSLSRAHLRRHSSFSLRALRSASLATPPVQTSPIAPALLLAVSRQLHLPRHV